MSIKRGQNGQAVIEIMIALVLAAFFLSGIITIQLYAVKNAQFARNKSTATTLAREQLERARVVRDSSGIAALDPCRTTCFINSQLTPMAVTPTGTFQQSLLITVASGADCPLPNITIVPQPTTFRTEAVASWSQGANVTPPARVILTSCLTDWH